MHLPKHTTLDTIDLDAYFQRIGYSGSRTSTLATLQAIHQHHAENIAFEKNYVLYLKMFFV